MITICLCDDNKKSLESYSLLLNKIADANNLMIKIFHYASGEQLLFEPEDKLCNFDIVYMDMLMGKLNGIETAKVLRNAGFSGQIIFLTSSKDYILESFEVTPLHYILKQDATDEKFAEVFLKASQLSRNHQQQSFVFENHSKISRILLSDILYFEVQIRQVYLQTFTERHCFYSQIDNIEKQLSTKEFARCHRSFVVNLQHIKSIKPTEITMINEQTIPVGSKYFKPLKSFFSTYLESKAVII